jgi:MSHA biogenesis protein MshL
MALFIQISLILLFISGCSNHEQLAVNETNTTSLPSKKTARQEMDAFKAKQNETQAPSMVLPPVYEEISIFGEEKITFSAEKANFRQVLHSISELSGLNLIIDQDVDTDIPITMSVHEASIEEVLNIVMDISGTYYTLQSNILHVKQFMQKSFIIPYVHSNTSFKTELGGDMLNSANSGGGGSSGGGSGKGVTGDFKLKYDNPEDMNGFYTQIEENLKSLISKDGRYTLNKFNGVLNVYDRKKRLDVIEKMIKQIKKRSKQQVLIEAKILEVVLNDDHALGVSWEGVANSILKAGDQLLINQTLGLSGAVAGTVTYTSQNFNAVITALDESGDVDTLSNPRIKVLSGQSAIISSGKLVPFWEKEVQTNQGTGGSASNTEVTYNRRDVLHGVTMGVTPVIMEDGQIMLNIIPITSSIEDVIEHFDENGKSVASAPILNVKEAGTIIFAKDNDLILIGGLINNTVKKTEEKIPLLGDIPLLGQLFSKTVNKDEKRELVILLKLNVVH